MTELTIIVVAVVAAIVLTWTLMNSLVVKKWKKVTEEQVETLNELRSKLVVVESERDGKQAIFDERLKAIQDLSDEKISALEKKLSEQKDAYNQAIEEEKKRSEKSSEDLKSNYERTLSEIKQNHQETLLKQQEAFQKQSDALKAEMLSKTEEILKQRQEELDKKANDTFQTITGNLGKDLKEMKTAFEENKTKNSEDSATMKEKFDNVVKQLADQTKSIGDKADHLADAMRGQKKLQGCWGETILKNLLDAEGMVEGRDYDKEETLRDELGMVIQNEDTEKRMRPDYLLHFVDNQDVVIDSKVSLSAFADYYEAETDEKREDATKRNLTAFKEQVKKLASKNYSNYLKPGRRMVDYVIMFVPNYSALQLAYYAEPKLWQWAYNEKVLITSAETLMPFLRTIFLAWRNVEQVKNQQRIIESAQNMITRVAEFTTHMQNLGKKLTEAQNAYDDADRKLKNSGQGILVSAHQVINLGVQSKKGLPEPSYIDNTL